MNTPTKASPGKPKAAPTRACPKCASAQTAPILYGYPADMDAYMKAVKGGEIIGGGCVVEARSPAWGCLACGHRWGALR